MFSNGEGGRPPTIGEGAEVAKVREIDVGFSRTNRKKQHETTVYHLEIM